MLSLFALLPTTSLFSTPSIPCVHCFLPHSPCSGTGKLHSPLMLCFIFVCCLFRMGQQRVPRKTSHLRAVPSYSDGACVITLCDSMFLTAFSSYCLLPLYLCFCPLFFASIFKTVSLSSLPHSSSVARFCFCGASH